MTLVPSADSRARFLWLAAALLVTLHSALLRWEALDGAVGWMDHPRWAGIVSGAARPAARHLRPAAVQWGPIPEPYVGGDPINYLKYAREMRHFYQAHVREPMHLAGIRLWLRLSGWRDIALSYTSFAASTLTVVATYLLGATISPAVGLVAAFLLGIEYHVIAASFEGQRDETFSLCAALTAWALVRLRQRQTWSRAAMAGVAGAAACLTRITAAGFVLAALVYLAATSVLRARRAGADPASRPAMFAVAGAIAVALVAPYLINCAISEGDPFLAVNYHARYYRSMQGLPPDPSVGAVEYITSRLAARPIGTIDTAFVGLFVFPFANKWDGYWLWSSWLGSALSIAAVAGSILALWSADGRLLLIILLTSLAPYALTWSVGGGGEWRFTEHAYPFYLVAAAAAIVGLPQILFRADLRAMWSARRLKQALALGVAGLGACAFYQLVPFVTMSEALAAGEAANVSSGGRDLWAFSGDWSAPIPGSVVTVRAAQSREVRVRVPMPPGAGYLLTLRMDPAETTDQEKQPHIAVFLNGAPLADLNLTRDPARMGTYRFQIPADRAKRVSVITFRSTHTVRAAEAGPRFSSLIPDQPVAFRLWYVRLERIS
jgi:cell shape-determining protein MreD